MSKVSAQPCQVGKIQVPQIPQTPITAELADEIKQVVETMLRARGLEAAHMELLRLRLFEAIETLAGDSEIRQAVLVCQLRRERERLRGV